MPQVDSDIVAVITVSRQGTDEAPTDMQVNLTWFDGITNENKGTFTTSWRYYEPVFPNDPDSLKGFLDGQTYEDILRALMQQCVNRNTGAFKHAAFDAMSGNSYEINIRVKKV